MNDELDDNGIPKDDEEESPSLARVAAPMPATTTPAANLRGLGSVSPAASDRAAKADTELSRLQNTGSGIAQVKSPVARGILRGLDTVGSIVAPRITAAIPGTELHHQALIGQEQGLLGKNLGEETSEANLGKTGAETEERAAHAGLMNAQTEGLNQPKPKEEKWDVFAGFTDKDGTPLIREENSGQVVRADDKKVPTSFQPLKPGEIKTEKTVRIVKGVPHEILVDAQTGKDIRDLGQTKIPGESADQKRNANEIAQVEREARISVRKAEGQYRATQQSVHQLQQGIDAAKDGNGLLTSFVPTMEVLGINASNGVHRISPAEAQAAGMPGSFVERFNAFFDKAATGKLTPQLQTEGKALAKILGDTAYQRYKSTYEDESRMVEGYGGKDFSKRVPIITAEEQAGGGGKTAKPAPGGAFSWDEMPQHNQQQ